MEWAHGLDSKKQEFKSYVFVTDHLLNNIRLVLECP